MNLIWFGLYEFNFLIVGFGLGACTVWLFALIVKYYFLSKHRAEVNHE